MPVIQQAPLMSSQQLLHWVMEVATASLRHLARK
jgi:hypothetical protein